MAVIDERIVSLDFDNKNFEKNAAQSQKTLEKLREALTLEDSAKKISKGVDSIADKLNSNNGVFVKAQEKVSLFGTFANQIVRNFANETFAAAQKVVHAFNWIPSQIKSGGWSRAMKIEDAKFQLEGLGVAWNKIEDDINYGVADTAYGLDSAAKAAASLTASGVKMGKEMKTALRGISGVAAMTNSTYDEISPIFTTVAGQGKLMTMQLRQLEMRGLNAAATLGKALNVSEAEVRDMVTKGKIDFQTFADAMDSAFGDHAKDANKTFAGALSNMKFALSKIGADFATPIMQNMVDVFNNVRSVFNGIRKELQGGIVPGFEKAFKKVTAFANAILTSNELTQIYQNTFKAITNALRNLSAILKPIREGWKDIFPDSLLKTVAKISEKVREFTEDFELSESTLQSLRSITKGLAASLSLVGKAISKIASLIKPLAPILNTIGGLVLKFLGWIGELIARFNEWVSTNEKIQTVLEVLKIALKVVAITIIEVIDAVIDLAGQFIQWVPWEGIIDGITGAIKRLVGFLAPILVGAIGVVIKAFQKLKDLDIINMFKTLGTTIKDKFLQIGSASKAGGKAVAAFFKAFKDSKNIAKGVKAAGKAFDQFDEAQSKLFGGGKINKIKVWFDDVKTSIGNGMESLNKFLDKVPWQEGLIVGFTGTLMNLMIKGSNFIKSATSFVDNIGGLVKSFKGIFDSFKTTLEAMTKMAKVQVYTKAILMVAGAIAILAGSLYLLTIPDPGKLDAAVTALGIMTGLMLAIAYVINQMVQSGLMQGFYEAAKGIIAMSASVFVMVLSINALANMMERMSGEQFAIAIGGVIGLMMSMVTVAFIMGKYVPKITKGAAFFILFAIAINVLVTGLTALSLIPFKHVQENLMILTGIIASIGVLAGLASQLKATSGLNLIAVVGSLWVLAVGLEKIATLDMETMAKNLDNYFVVFGLLIGLVILMSRLNGMDIGAAGAGVLAVSASLYVIASAMNKISSVNLGEDAIIKVGFILGAFAIALAGVYAIVNVAKGLKLKDVIAVGGLMLALSIMLVAMVGVCKLMGMLKPEEIAKGTIAMGAITLMLMGVMWASNYAKGVSVGVLIAAVAGIVTLSVSMLMLSMLPWQNVITSGAAMLLALIGFAAVLHYASENINAKGIAGILVATVAMAALATIIGLMVHFSSNTNDLLKAAAALSILAVCMAIVMSIISGVGDLKALGSVAIFALLAGSMIILGYALQQFVGIDWKTFAVAIASLGAFAGAMMLLGTVMTALSGFVIGMVLLPVLLVALSISLIALATAIKQFTGIDWKTFGMAIAAFGAFTAVLLIAGAIATLVTPGLLALSVAMLVTAIALLALTPALISLQNVDMPTIAAGLAAVAGGMALIGLAGATLVIGAAGVLAFSLALLVLTGVVAIAMGMFLAFAQAISALANLGDAGKQMADAFTEGFRKIITDIPGVIGDWVGGLVNTAKGFFSKLFGVGKDQGDELVEGFRSGIDAHSDAVEGKLAMMDWLGGLIHTGEDNAGLLGALGNLQGESLVDGMTGALSGGIGEFASGLNVYDKLANSSIGNVLKKIGLLQKATNNLTTADARAEMMALHNANKQTSDSTDDLTDGLDDLTSGLDDFSSGAGGASKSAEELEKQAQRLDNTIRYFSENFADTLDLIEDENPWEKSKEAVLAWGKTIAESGESAEEAISRFYGTIEDAISNQLSTFDEFKREDPMDPEQILANMKSQVDGISAWANNMSSLADKGINQGLLDKLAEMGPQGAKYVEAFTQMTADQLGRANDLYAQQMALPSSAAAQITASFAKAGLEAGKNLDSGVGKGIRDNTKEVKDEGAEMARKTVEEGVAGANGFDSHSPSKKGEEQGKYLDQGVAWGITKNTEVVQNAATNMAKAVVRRIGSEFANADYSGIGKNVGSGLAKGISESVNDALEAVANLGESVSTQLASILKIKSPSRVTYAMGEYFVEGFANAVADNTYLASDSVGLLGADTINSMESSIAKLYDLITNEIDPNPVITPVLDLSQVATDAERLNDMLTSATYTARNTRSASSQLQNGSNHGAYYNITINAGYGADGRAIAREVEKIMVRR